MHSWLFFLPYFKLLRDKILNEALIENLLHLGTRAFEEIDGEVVQSVSFVVMKSNINMNLKGSYLNLTNYNSSYKKKNLF